MIHFDYRSWLFRLELSFETDDQSRRDDLRREWMVIYFSRLLYFCPRACTSRIFSQARSRIYPRVSGWTTHQSRLTLGRNTTCGLFLSLRDAVSGRSYIRDRIESILSLPHLAYNSEKIKTARVSIVIFSKLLLDYFPLGQKLEINLKTNYFKIFLDFFFFLN